MSELGWTLLWLAVQVVLLLVPALAIQARASRRGPASGAWVAGLSLGLVLALSAAALVPRGTSGVETRLMPSVGRTWARVSGAEPAWALSGSGDQRVPARAASPRRSSLAGFWLAWGRLERGATAPAVRFRSWGTSLAVVALAGSAVGLVRLLVGLWAVRLCRRSGRAVDDPGLMALLDELRRDMGCHRRVELRAFSHLTTPATAGWRYPVVFLPDDWRSWDDSERRAVLAHELAHIVRGDYATGLLARAALVFHIYHPLVHWMAWRLQIQQELAADALGARFAGGRLQYLVALSRMALRQDGHSPGWPARAFLPPQGTLIRRIAMLSLDTEAGDRTRSRSRQACVGLCLIGIACGVATLRGPASSAGAESPPGESLAAVPAPRTGERDQKDEAIELVYIPENSVGVVSIRPAAMIRRAAQMEKLLDWLAADIGLNQAVSAIDPKKSGLPRLKAVDIEWVACGVRFGQSGKLHTLIVSGFTVRTTQPFDWLKLIHAWGIETTEVRDGMSLYYKFSVPAIGPGYCGAYYADDRTFVLDNEVQIRRWIHRDVNSVPAFVENTEWQEASRGLLAVAINNKDDALAKGYDLGRPDDAVLLSLVKGVDHWIGGIADNNELILRAAAACQSVDASEAITRTIGSLRKLGQTAFENPGPKAPTGDFHDRARGMVRAFLANLRIGRTDRSIDVRAEGFGTLADFAAYVEAEAEEKAQKREVEEEPEGSTP